MVTTIWAGLSVGAIYAIAGLTYNLGYIASGVFNFAQAQFVVVGTFVAYYAGANLKVSIVLAIIGGALFCAVLAGLEDVIALRPLAGSGLSGELITTVGVAVLIEGIILLVAGPDPQRVPYIQSDSFTLLGGRILPAEALLIVCAVAFTVILATLSRRTTLGVTALAAAENRRAATLRGVNVKALSLGAFMLAGAIAGGLGPVIGAKTFATFDLGDGLALKAFVVLAIGGFGSFGGALIGGMAVGLVEALSTRWLGDNYANIMVLVVLVLILLIKPSGLFGRRVERTV